MRLVASTLAFLAIPALSPAAGVTGVAPRKPRVEVAFVLDTTGSMAGLIEGAKRRIWSIARRIGEGRPRPDLRIALVGYRDRGDAYITKLYDLTSDMDDVYQNLMSFTADGGGDTPEHVSAGLHDAVNKVSWSHGPALRMIFLVGDAPPHLDYQDGFDYRRHASEARQRGIVVEAIECGGDPETARVWQEIASLGEGHFARIDAGGGMTAQVTPVDAELARLNAELTSTVVAAGTARERAAAARKMESRAAMPPAMAAEAAGYFARADRLAEKDLVDLPAAEQKKALEDIKARPAEAPAALAGKSDAEALVYLETQHERRAQLQARITALQKERDTLLAGAAGTKDAFDEQVVKQLAARARSFGIQY